MKNISDLKAKIAKLEKQNKALNDLCLRLLNLLEEDNLEEETDGIDRIVTLTGEHESFRCVCGCNIFRNLKSDESKYKCNACKES